MARSTCATSCIWLGAKEHSCCLPRPGRTKSCGSTGSRSSLRLSMSLIWSKMVPLLASKAIGCLQRHDIKSNFTASQWQSQIKTFRRRARCQSLPPQASVLRSLLVAKLARKIFSSPRRNSLAMWIQKRVSRHLKLAGVSSVKLWTNRSWLLGKLIVELLRRRTMSRSRIE